MSSIKLFSCFFLFFLLVPLRRRKRQSNHAENTNTISETKSKPSGKSDIPSNSNQPMEQTPLQYHEQQYLLYDYRLYIKVDGHHLYSSRIEKLDLEDRQQYHMSMYCMLVENADKPFIVEPPPG
jgi:hypothetical protein